MNTLQMFLQLPLSEQRRLIKASRKISRLSAGVFPVDHAFTTMVEITWARRENTRNDRAQHQRDSWAVAR